MGSGQFVPTFVVLQFVALVVLGIISYFLKRSLLDLDTVEDKVAKIEREGALRTDVRVVDQKIDTLRDAVDTRLDTFKDGINEKLDNLKDTMSEKIGDLKTQVTVIIDRDRMRRLEDYDQQGLTRRKKEN